MNTRPLAEPRGLARPLAEPRELVRAGPPRIPFFCFPRTNRNTFGKGVEDSAA